MGCIQTSQASTQATSSSATTPAKPPNNKNNNKSRINESEDELLYAEVIHRHGDRTPSILLETELKEESIWIPTLPSQYALMRLNDSKTDSKSDSNESKIIYTVPKDEVLSWKSINSTLKVCKIVNSRASDSSDSSSDAIYFRDNEHAIKWLGRLTSIGVTQCKQTGEALRRRYVDQLKFLPEDVPLDALSSSDASEASRQASPSQASLWYQADNDCRDVYSAESVLLGLYPGLSDACGSDQSNPKLKFPIYVDAEQSFLEIFWNVPTLKTASDLLAKNAKEIDDTLLSPEIEEMRQKVLDKYDGAKERVDVSEDGTNYAVEDAYTCRVSHYETNERIDKNTIDLDLARNYTKLAFKRLLYSAGKDVNKKEEEKEENGAEALRLSSGVLLSELMDRIEKSGAGGGSNGCKVRLVAAHDSTLIALLVALNRQEGNVLDLADKFAWPRYAGWMSLEVWRKRGSSGDNNIDGEKFVKVVYDDKDTKIGGKIDMKLEELQEFWKDVLMSREQYLQMVNQQKE